MNEIYIFMYFSHVPVFELKFSKLESIDSLIILILCNNMHRRRVLSYLNSYYMVQPYFWTLILFKLTY